MIYTDEELKDIITEGMNNELCLKIHKGSKFWAAFSHFNRKIKSSKEMKNPYNILNFMGLCQEITGEYLPRNLTNEVNLPDWLKDC